MLPHWEWDKLAWQTLPPGGLGINKSPASFLDLNSSWSEWWWWEQGSSNEPAWDCLTKSSRLVDFCSSSNSFYGLNSSTGLSPPCTHRCVDHPTDLCLIRSPTCSLDHCRPSDSLSLSLHFTALYLSIQPIPFILSLRLTVCCGTETAPGWRCLSPQGGRGPTSGRGSGPQGGAGPAWPHTTSMSSSREKKECHQLRSAVKLPRSVQLTGRVSQRVFLSLIKSPNLEALVFTFYF